MIPSFRLVETAVAGADVGRCEPTATLRFEAELRGQQSQRKPRQKWSARADATLLITGSSISGVCVIEDRIYHVTGKCQRIWRESLSFDLALRDALGGAGNFALVGAMQGQVLRGHFVGVSTTANLVAISGVWRAPKLWWQAPPEHECGRLLYEQEGATQYPNAKGTVRMRIRRYERCVEVEILDPEGQPLDPPRKVHLDEDLNHPVNDQVRVLVYDAPDPGTPMPKREGGELVRYGEFKFIAVQGCANPALFQFVRITGRTTPPNGQPGTENDLRPWSTDNSAHPIPPRAPDGTNLWDHPGVPEGFAPPNQPEGTVALLTYYLETFVCCDGTLLGYVSWGFTLTMTYDQNRRPSIPVVAPTRPTWHPPGDSPRAAQVQCPH